MTDEKKESKESTNWLVGFDKLFTPTFQYLGEELRDSVKAKLEEYKDKKKRENTSLHLAAVIDREPEGKVESIEQLELFTEWLEGAENISDTQKELSAIWRGILKDIKNGVSIDPVIIERTKLITPHEAEVLLYFKYSKMLKRWEFLAKTGRESYYLRQLEKKDIVINDSLTFRIFGIAISTRRWKLTWIGEHIRKMHDIWTDGKPGKNDT
ncbi:hypothetical protein [Alteromonas sp. KUL49]|uniref:hypothetical protein n=1 Tax=Alteromonas sp. KUL49 TaxID=2480798 RepID=UPI00102F228C|nr:hypothetical protein [Alteromonas sp. KUL49]TAP40957.1 hypothetical protein EYS00_07575 [Alteromonas sp. KUL49]GEA11139.1 hypothetical protein KUL49_15140 [Alteromonas sp. KUL49]